MFNRFFGIIILFFSLNLIAQDSLLINKKYREDQIFFNITYNNLIHKPSALTQQGVSVGFHTGFIRDIALNDMGSLALGIGLGYAYDKYQSNLLYNSTDNILEFTDEDFIKNKIETHAIEIPFEIRFRKSTPTQYKFWRVYFGGKIAYNFYSKNVYKTDSKTSTEKPSPYISKLQYGPQLAIGYNAWNLYAFWNSKPLFDKAPITETLNPNDIQNLKIGLQFYVF